MITLTSESPTLFFHELKIEVGILVLDSRSRVCWNRSIISRWPLFHSRVMHWDSLAIKFEVQVLIIIIESISKRDSDIPNYLAPVIGYYYELL